jgi:5-methylcytosine-specific restriction enzyme A
MTCKICGRPTDKGYKHYLIPKVKGGKKGEIIECCKTCSRQVHMLFSEGELAKMTLEELLSTDAMQEYLKWIKNRSGDFKVKKSRRLRGR